MHMTDVLSVQLTKNSH